MQVAVAIACGAPVNSPKAASKSFTRGPWVSVVPFSTSATAARSSSPIIGLPKGIISIVATGERLEEVFHRSRRAAGSCALDGEAHGQCPEDLLGRDCGRISGEDRIDERRDQVAFLDTRVS